MQRRDVTPTGERAGEIRVGLVASSFNASITRGLLDGALGWLESAGVGQVTVVTVAGALELPVVARKLAEDHEAVIAVGAVIEGETDHYQHVATQASAGLMSVSTDTGVPVGNALLTVREIRHALERSRPGPGNKGAEAAEAAIKAAEAIAELSNAV